MQAVIILYTATLVTMLCECGVCKSVTERNEKLHSHNFNQATASLSCVRLKQNKPIQVWNWWVHHRRFMTLTSRVFDPLTQSLFF